MLHGINKWLGKGHHGTTLIIQYTLVTFGKALRRPHMEQVLVDVAHVMHSLYALIATRG